MASGSSATPPPPLRVGYALREKRVRSFILPDLIEAGKAAGVEYVAVDAGKPLSEQGPFDMILHKLDSPEWAANLKSFLEANPRSVVVDDFDAVHKLDDRREMLEVVHNIKEGELHMDVSVPSQLIVEIGTKPEEIRSMIAKSGFRLPAVSKPLAANGTTSSHSLCLVLSDAAIEHLEPPLVLQEFVNHGGILFKLYVLGEKVMVFRRQSLPDIDPSEILSETKPGQEGLTLKAPGLVEFNRISNVHMSEEELQQAAVVDPPPEVMRALGTYLRQNLKLNTFNVDILREGGSGDKYFIVDINYMPGYERIPEFGDFFTRFCQTMVTSHRKMIDEQGADTPRENLFKRQLSTTPPPVPPLPYPVLMGKKKWVYFKAAMKLCGLDMRKRSFKEISQ